MRNEHEQSVSSELAVAPVAQDVSPGPEAGPPAAAYPRPAQTFALRAGAAAVALVALLASMPALIQTSAQAVGQDATPLQTRHVGAQRSAATRLPRGESDQALVDGWPLYRTERGQAAFNDAMATLKATDTAAPAALAFKGCAGLECNLVLPKLGEDGWIPAGRLWVSPSEYVLIVHSPRSRGRNADRRRTIMGMKYFVFHEFHNSSRNNDPYDTISSHSGSVFVSFYMSKESTDARGRRFVVVVQVAPHDVISIHASNYGSAGPGIEVAKNVSEQLEPLQATAGVLVATIVKTAAPFLKVVNHRGSEGLPMLNAYDSRLAWLRTRPGAATVTLPFMPAPANRVAAATGRIDHLIQRGGASKPLPMAERGILPPRAPIPEVSFPEPVLVGPIRQATRRGLTAGQPTLVVPPQPATRSVLKPANSSL